MTPLAALALAWTVAVLELVSADGDELGHSRFTDDLTKSIAVCIRIFLWAVARRFEAPGEVVRRVGQLLQCALLSTRLSVRVDRLTVISVRCDVV